MKKNGFALDLRGWQELEKKFSCFLYQHMELTVSQPLKIIANSWFPAAHLNYYVAGPLKAEVIGIGALIDLDHHPLLNRYRQEILPGENAICILPRNYQYEVESAYHSQFSSIRSLKNIPLERKSKKTVFISVFLLKSYIETPRRSTSSLLQS